MVQSKNIALYVVLSLVTCGIFSIYWLITMNDDINKLTGKTDGTSGVVVFLLSIVTCGIYLYYWFYKKGEDIDGLYVAKGQTAPNKGIVYLILAIFGLSIVSFALLQDEINKNATAA